MEIVLWVALIAVCCINYYQRRQFKAAITKLESEQVLPAEFPPASEAQASLALELLPDPVLVVPEGISAAPVPVPLTPEQVTSMRANRCAHCGGVHGTACPRIRRLRFRPDGSTLWEVEFWETWDRSRTIYLEDYLEGPGVPEPTQDA